MICKKPFRKGVMEFGCGQCMPCRINRQRQWVARLQLETLTSPLSAFVTLTYDDEHLPDTGTVVKRDVQLWLKRLRELIHPRKLRYFLVAEYGEQTFRPHYHVILFGVTFVENTLLRSSWTLGGVHVGTVEPGSLSYVCGYVLKKMTKKNDPRLGGRHPEFTLMSRKPGIGTEAVGSLAAAYRTVPGKKALEVKGWISPTVRIGPKIYPLGRYLSQKLSQTLGLTETQRKAHNERIMVETFLRKSRQTTTEYEKARRARCEQQEGRVNLLPERPL